MNPIHRHSFRLVLLLLTIVVAALPFALARAQDATPPPEAPADACEPANDRPARACVLELEANNGPYTFAPAGDQDYYSLFLAPANHNLATTILLSGSPGLELHTTITQHESGTVLGRISSPAISFTLAPDVSGWIIVQVENRSRSSAAGESYWIDVRASLPAPLHSEPASKDVSLEKIAPDQLENNYDVRHAAPVAVNAVYELNFICPVEAGCPGGDHDYLRASVKAGVEYLFATYDLAPGVDTSIELFWDDPQQSWIAANDDLHGGKSFLSALRWRAPMDGLIIVRIGPRDGGLRPIISDPAEAGQSYRFSMALAESNLGRQLAERVAEQALLPTPTSLPLPAGAPAAAAGSNEKTAATTATAVPTPTAIPIIEGGEALAALVISNTVVLVDPEPAGLILAELPIDTLVRLTGRSRGMLIEINGAGFVGAGWADRRMLRPAGRPADLSPTSGTTLPAGAARPEAAPAGPADAASIQISRRQLAAPPAAAVTAPLREVSLPVQLRAGAQPLAGIQMHLLSADGKALTIGRTDASGRVTLNAFIPEGTALLIQSPALLISQIVYDPNVPQIFVLPGQP